MNLEREILINMVITIKIANQQLDSKIVMAGMHPIKLTILKPFNSNHNNKLITNMSEIIHRTMEINKFIIKTCTKIILIIRIYHLGLLFNKILARKTVCRIQIFKYKQVLINSKIINLIILQDQLKILLRIFKIKSILKHNLNSEIKDKNKKMLYKQRQEIIIHQIINQYKIKAIQLLKI